MSRERRASSPSWNSICQQRLGAIQPTSGRYEIEEMLRPSPDETDEKEQAALLKITVARYVKDLELVERLDAGVERALALLEKYQRKRMTGSLSPTPPQHRAPAWGRVRQ